MNVEAMGPVFKFGGTSMGSLERIVHVAELCARLRPAAVVVSAMAGDTNRLVTLAKGLSQRTDVPEYDLLVASGEQVSVALLSLALRERGIIPAPMLAPHAGIVTNSHFSRAQIVSIDKTRILKHINAGEMPIIAGFQGITGEGQFTSLGRGGSDTSAVAIAAGIGTSECVIYTDVDGVYTTDPRIFSKARIISQINTEEMLEMASQGAKILHIRSVQLAAKWGIRLRVRNTFSEHEGTVMSSDCESIEGEIVTGIAATSKESLVQIGPLPKDLDTLARVFTCLAEHSINVDIITQNFDQTGISVNFTIVETDVVLAQKILSEAFPNVPLKIRNDVAKVSIVGVGMRTHAGVAATMFKVLAREKIEIHLVATSEIKVACLVLRSQLNAAVCALHSEFIKEDTHAKSE